MNYSQNNQPQGHLSQGHLSQGHPSQEPRMITHYHRPADDREKQVEPFPPFSPKRGKLFEALAKARAQFPFIKKDAENDNFGSKYATLSNILAGTTKILSNHNLVVTQLIDGDKDFTYLTAILALGGSEEWISSKVVLPRKIEKLDSSGRKIIKYLNPWDRGSEITYFQRYAYASLLGITIVNDDDGKKAISLYKDNKPPAIPKITERDLDLLQHEIGEDENLLLTIKNNLKLGMLADMPASQFGRALDLIKRTKREV